MNAVQYRRCLRCIDSLMADDPEVGTDMGNALDALAKMCEEYEKKHWPFGEPTPEALAEFRRLELRL